MELPEDTRCCSGIRSVPPADLPHWQRISPGTTAWRRSMGRRQRAEGANAGLKGGYVDITRKHIRVLGRTKMMFLLSFTIAGYNRDRIRAFLKKTAHEATAPKTRAKRRRGTYKDILGVSVGGSGRDPPAAAAVEPD